MKVQRRSCKLSFLFPPRRQSARPVLKLSENPVNVKRIKVSAASFFNPVIAPPSPGFGFKSVRLYAVLSPGLIQAEVYGICII